MQRLNEIIGNLSKRNILILSFSILILLNSVFVFIYFPERFKEQTLNSHIDKTNTIAVMAAINIGSALYFDDIENVQESIISLMAVKGVTNIIIFDTTFQPIIISSPATINEQNSNTGFTKKSSYTKNNKFYVAVKPVFFNRKNIGAIAVYTSLNEINHKVSEAKQIISFISIIMFLISFIVVVTITSYFIRPLLKLVNTSLKISNGDLSSRVDIKSKDEFGKLATYFNSMVDKVEESQKKLYEMNVELEDLVEERTNNLLKEIEKRKQTESILRESEEKYRNIFEKFHDLYFKIDPTGKIIELSPSVHRITGYQVDELLNKNIDIFLDNKSEKVKLIKKLILERVISNYEFDIIIKNGESLTVNINSQVEVNKNGEIEFISGTLHDISNLKKIEQKLSELNATKDKFFSILAHDLRNPISSFMQGTEILASNDDDLSDEDRTEIINSLFKSSKNLLELLENLLTWSRTQTGKITFVPELADITPIINNNISLVGLQARNKKIVLKAESKENTFGYFDVNSVNTVIRNLISNSIKFTPEFGRITIGSKIENNSLVVWVKDSGVGMDQEVMENLFRIDTAQTTLGTADEKGTGLGLILCKELIEKNNGNIRVESQEGQGSCFIITLPLSKD